MVHADMGDPGDDDGVPNVRIEVLTLLENGDLDGAHDRWFAAHASAWFTQLAHALSQKG